ncbi:MAG TPA: PKD domain-containing protein [Puia sp.]|nr:PKD domain-containing protein [Puia sp.]
MNRKLFILAGCFCLLGIIVRAQAPVAAFTSNVTSGCSPLQVRFQDQSSNNPTSWEWDFGNGQTSSGTPTPSVVYTSPGTYTVTLIVKNASGAGAVRDSNYITVYASPNVSFGLNHLACSPADIQFQQYSQPGQGTITSYVWNFGDGSSGSGATPDHVYTQPGYYTVSLTVTNSGGCTNTATYTRTLRLVSGVQTNFAWNETGNTCTAPFTLDFLNQTAGPGTMTYSWSFGGGAAPTASNATNPNGIAYPSAGSYPVTLIASSSLGCADTLTQTVPLSSNSPVINGPASGCINTPVSFSNGTKPAPLSSSWSWGDGTAGSGDSAATHTYTAAGTYTVTLTNTYAGCTTTASSTITIGAALVPTFTAAPVSACQAPLTVQFTDQTTPAPTQWSWNFGDGGTASGSPTPTHTYTTTGNFNVTLTATTAAGCSGTATLNSEVNVVAPTITIPAQGACVNKALSPSYTVNSVDPVTTYTWSAPGATPSTATGASPSFTWPSAGYYSLTLTIQTASGCSASQTFTNVVEVGTPTPASFTYDPPSPICGTATVNLMTPSLPAQEWYWNFGDGSPLDSGQSVTHQFQKFGNETVTLSVVNNGCTTFNIQTVTVSPPIAKFVYGVNCAVSNLQVSFTDSSLTQASFGAISYTWTCSDGYTYTGAPPNQIPPPHTFPGPGTYTVTLTVTNGTCQSTFTKQITLQAINASFTVSPNPVCNQQPFTLTSTSTTQPVGTPNAGYIWAFGPGDTVHGASNQISHINGVGTYNATLTVIDQNGCRYTSIGVAITVIAPTAKFTPPPGGCENSPITFTDQSTPSTPGTGFTEYIWNFGDGSPAQTFPSPPFTHQYADTGSYTVIEEVVDNGGCYASDTIQAAVQITSPHALFIEPDSFYCPATPAAFTDLSTGYGLTWSWNFGDGSGPGASTQQDPRHAFPAATGVTYPITETITDKYGCTTDTTENITIESPVAAFTIADTTSICVPLQTMFTSTSQYYDSLYWEFGDGQTSTLAPGTSHFYNALDTFTATLVVQGPGGCLDSTSRKVYLTNPNTTVFNFTPTTACDSVVAQFTIVPPPYTTFILGYGDNSIDSSGNLAPIHTYRSPNTFIPYLDLTDATGCIVPVENGTLTVLGAVPFFTAAPVAFCDTGTVVFNDFTITNNGVQSKTYSFGDGSTASQPPPQTNPFDTTHYYNTPGTMLATLTVVTLANCTASYTDTIRVYQTPQPVISDSGYLCAGLIQFLGTLAVPDIDTLFWKWDFGNGQTANIQNPVANAAAGTYTVTLIASTSFGCADTTSTSVTINPNPTIKGPKVITTPVGVPVTIPFTYSPDVTTWSWTPEANLSCTDCATPAATLIFAQSYSVLVTDSNHCTDTASILINTICNEGNYFFPNTFSPNGDGMNDYFYPRGSGLYNIQSLTIFNRWGQMVFQRKNFPANSETMGWDGTFNGKPAPMDAYVYVAEVICANAQVVAIHGNVTLVR